MSVEQEKQYISFFQLSPQWWVISQFLSITGSIVNFSIEVLLRANPHLSLGSTHLFPLCVSLPENRNLIASSPPVMLEG